MYVCVYVVREIVYAKKKEKERKYEEEAEREERAERALQYPS